MPDAGASRKRQIPAWLVRGRLASSGLLFEFEALNGIPEAGATYCYARVTNAFRMRQREPQEFFQRDLRCRFGMQPRLQSEFAR
jgi:hypothetical protein